MKKLNLTTSFVLAFSIQNLYGFDTTECENIAQGLLNHLSSSKKIASMELNQNRCIASFSDGGYSFITASIGTTPIKTYSLTGSFTNLPQAMKDMLEQQVANEMKQSFSVENPIRIYLKDLKYRKVNFRSTIQFPLVTTQWNQDGFYQKFMPKVDNTPTYVGCVNVALAQIMRYHKYPQKGSGYSRYTWNNQTLEAITNRPYNWDNMPNIVSSSSQEYQIDEVAMLLYDLGVSNQTDFGVNGSGATFNKEMLYKNFGYSTNIQTIEATDKTAFFNAVKNEINAYRPAYLSIPATTESGIGHAVVVDNYNDDEIGKLIHLNFGWGGSNDAYYDIDTSPEVEGLNLTSGELKLYYHITPCSQEAGDCYTPNTIEDGDEQTNNSLTGKIHFDGDEDTFEVYLSGDTNITAESDYYNTPDFFVNIYNGSDELVFSSDLNKTIFSHTFAPSKYTINVSKKTILSKFQYQTSPATNNYFITFDSNLTTEEKLAIDKSLISTPKIFDNFKTLFLTPNETYKFVVNAADKVSQTEIFETIGDKEIVDINQTGNILNLIALKKGMTNIKVKAFANGKETFKILPIIVTDEKINMGKEITLKDTFTDDLSKVITFSAVLDGECTISGDRGYSGTAFFISVPNQIAPTDTPINSTFSKNIYDISASLQYIDSNNTTLSYDLNNHPDFQINISCPNADTSNESIASVANITTYTLESNSTLDIRTGWNLISLPSSDTISSEKLLDEYPDSSIIWKFQNNNWYASTKNSATTLQLKALNIAPIDFISATDGFWLYATAPFTLSSDGNIKKIDLSKISSGWNLVGTSTDTTPQAIKLTVPNSSIIWKYKEGAWETDYSGDLPTGVTPLESIESGDGFWVRVTE